MTKRENVIHLGPSSTGCYHGASPLCGDSFHSSEAVRAYSNLKTAVSKKSPAMFIRAVASSIASHFTYLRGDTLYVMCSYLSDHVVISGNDDHATIARKLCLHSLRWARMFPLPEEVISQLSSTWDTIFHAVSTLDEKRDEQIAKTAAAKASKKGLALCHPEFSTHRPLFAEEMDYE